MKVLMISTDRRIFEEGSSARSRMIAYGGLVEELHIIVYSTKKDSLVSEKLSENTTIYPTNVGNKFFSPQKAFGIAQDILKNKDDSWVISTQDPFETGIVGVKVSRRYSIPLQVQVHTDFLSPHFVGGSVLNRIRVHLARKTLPHAACIRVVSRRIKESIEVKYRLSVTPVVLPIFIDITAMRDAKQKFDIHDGYPKFDTIVLMNSRLEREKNIPLALRAFKKVVEKYPNTGLVIVGEGRKRVELEKQVNVLGIKDNVVFEGWKNEVASYYKTADVFLNTSNYEGYGMTLIESAEARCPIITTNVGVVGDILNESNASVCSVGDEECITEKMMSFIENKEMHTSLAEKAFIDTQTTLPKSQAIYLEKYTESLSRCFTK